MGIRSETVRGVFPMFPKKAQLPQGITLRVRRLTGRPAVATALRRLGSAAGRPHSVTRPRHQQTPGCHASSDTPGSWCGSHERASLAPARPNSSQPKR